MNLVQTLRYELGDWDRGAWRVLARLESLPRDMRWWYSIWR